MGWHDLGQCDHGGTVVAGIQEGQPELGDQHVVEAGIGHQPVQHRVGAQDRQHGEGDQDRQATNAVGQRAHDGEPDEIGQAHAKRHQQAVGGAQVEHALAKGRRVHRDQVERHRGHHDQHHAGEHQSPVVDHGADDLRERWMVLARQEFFGFLQRTADHEQERNDHAADEKRDAPAPVTDVLRRHPLVQAIAQHGGRHDGDLLAGRLPADVKALVARRGHFRQVDRHAAQLDAGGKPLQQPPGQHQQRRQRA